MTFANVRPPLLVAVLIGVLSLGCSLRGDSSDAEIREEMRDVYVLSDELFSFAWSADESFSAEEKKRVSYLLARLDKDFHKVEKVAGSREIEPGFEQSLKSQQLMLRDIRKRLKGDNDEYTIWRLRGMMSNCVSCHSRFAQARDFPARGAKTDRDTFAGSLAEADFLVATRQFDKGSAALLRLARDTDNLGISAGDSFDALKHWLLVEVRVKARYLPAAETIKSIQRESRFDGYRDSILEAWVADLKDLANFDGGAGDLSYVGLLLENRLDNESIEAQERRLVKTLRATAILHQMLSTKLPPEQRREALYLLGYAYEQIPIASLEGFGDAYLEQCIEDFPGTEQARKAYRLYKDSVEVQATGSGGIHLDDEQLNRLSELRKLAFG